jgi:pyruvate dehydrogenase E2 component (dihydrolipoyllysine-residue acetyltransferase)
MSVSVSMPQLGESVTEGTVTRWLKREGEHVSADEPLLEVSTDKVDTEIPSPVSGVLRGITVAEDETVAVGAELAVIDEDGAAGAPAPAAADAGGSAPAPESASYAPPAEQYAAPAEQYAPLAEQYAPPADHQAPAEQHAQPAEQHAQPAEQHAQPAEQHAAPAQSGYQFSDPEPHRYDEDQHTSYTQAQPEPEPSFYQQPAYQQPAAQPQTGYEAPGQSYGYQVEPAQEPPGVGLAEPPAATGPARADGPAETEGPAEGDGAESAYVTPLVRKLAAEHGIDLGTIPGTGVGGRIRKQDVLDAARAKRGDAAPGSVSGYGQQEAPAQPVPAQAAPAQPAAQVQPAPAQPAPAQPVPAQAVPPAAAAPASAAPSAPVQPAPPPGLGAAATARAAAAAAGSERAAAQAAASAKRGTTERLSRARQVIAQRMVESLQTSAQLTTVVEADVTAIARLRDRAKSAFEAREGVKLSFLPFFALAAIEALKVHPTLNAVLDAANGTVTYHDAEHLGIAVDTDRGLMVPVIRNAGDLNIAGLARKVADLAQRTRAGQVSPDDLSGGTFTLTNTGSRGALFDTPIINQPQVGILGTGTVNKRAVVVDDPDLGEVITVRSIVYLALTYDHRLVDGADAARFLVTIKTRLEEGAFESELGF